MVDWGPVGQLCLTSLAIMGSPGPATVSVVAAGSVYGVRRSLPYTVGVIAGTVGVLVAVATGVTAALLALPAIRPVLIGVSGAYLLWLAYRVATAPPISAAGRAAAPTVAGGALLGIVNPKGWVACAAVFASGHLAHSATADAAAKLAVLSCMAMLIMVTWLAASTGLAPLLRHPVHARVVNGSLAVALVVATAVGLLR